MTQTNSQYIAPPIEGRRFVIADIHGCNQTLQALVWEQLKLTKQDQLFLLGDYINRGPDSLGVIEFIMGLQATGYAVFPLRGNHEQMLIERLRMRDRLSEETLLTGRKSLARQINTDQRAWLNALPHYYELDRFYLVHGAINTQAENPLADFEYMLWQRTTHEPSDFLKGKQLIHGHTKHFLKEIEQAIAERHDCIPLDNGCYEGSVKKLIYNPYYGSLCALDIDNWTLFVQENKDKANSLSDF